MERSIDTKSLLWLRHHHNQKKTFPKTMRKSRKGTIVKRRTLCKPELLLSLDCRFCRVAHLHHPRYLFISTLESMRRLHQIPAQLVTCLRKSAPPPTWPLRSSLRKLIAPNPYSNQLQSIKSTHSNGLRSEFRVPNYLAGQRQHKLRDVRRKGLLDILLVPSVEAFTWSMFIKAILLVAAVR